MKWLCYILSLYMLVLICVPCGDNIECKKITQEQEGNAGNHDSHNHEQENCSPFCLCSCCSIAINTTEPLLVSFELTHFIEHITVHIPFSIPKISSHIWQPPRS
ncbi:DUF6660 family protein [Solitalea longa]|uniref:DUF6660 family protein n=1 Tax=Solitalea longa TaxID=2079460 RepID=UPI003743F6D8